MSGPSFTVPPSTFGVSGLPATATESQDRNFFGEDVYFTTATLSDEGAGQPAFPLTAAGDYTTVTGLEALRQSMIRRLITDPGAWKTKPNYGCGARRYVKERNTEGKRSELASTIRAQFAQDPRIRSVDVVMVHPLDDGSPGLKVSITVTPAGRLFTGVPITVVHEVT